MLASYLMNQASEMWGKKWRAAIIWALRFGPLRFSQLKSELSGVSVKVLSESLKDLEDHDLIVRKQYDGIPVKVTYELHEDTIPLIRAQEYYVEGLIRYFYRHKDKYALPEWVIQSLEKEYVTMQ